MDHMAGHSSEFVTLQQLRVFAAIASRGSLAGAAQQLGLSEPTVSSHLYSLERVIGATLVERSRGRRPVRLTDAGQMILGTCNTVLQTLDEGLDRVRADYGLGRSTISVGASAMFGAGILPRMIELFRGERPSVTVKMEIDRAPLLIESVKRGRLDLAICLGPIEDDQVTLEPYGVAELAIFGPVGHALSRGTMASWERLAQERIIMSLPVLSPSLLVQAEAANRGVTLNVVMESDDLYSRMQAISSGLGVGPMYVDTAASEVEAGHLSRLSVDGLPLRVQRHIIHARGELPHAARDFLELLLRHPNVQVGQAYHAATV